MRLIGETELRTEQAADGLEIEYVRRRGLDVAVLSRNEERREDEQRRDRSRDPRLPTLRRTAYGPYGPRSCQTEKHSAVYVATT